MLLLHHLLLLGPPLLPQFNFWHLRCEHSLRTELYGLIFPLWFQYGVAIDPTSCWSISKRYLTSAIKLPSDRSDMFPKWDVRDLLAYLSSRVFEPMVDKSRENCRVTAIILMMLATGRRLEDVQALTKTWYECISGDGISYVRFTF